MYYLTLSGFISEFLTTGALFVLCFLAVVGAKYLLLSVKEYLPKTKLSIPQKSKKPLQPPKKRRAKVISSNIKPIRSIEIDPNQIDRIYVKKSS